MAYTMEELQEMARELADMVGNEVMDECLPLEVLEMTADILKDDYKKIMRAAEEAAEDIIEEQREIEKLR